MGTSINHASPDVTIWNVVAACYDKNIPLEQTATVLWRAVTTQNDILVRQLKSETVAALVQQEVVQDRKLRQTVGLPKENTIASELVKRSVQIRTAGGYKADSSLAGVFRQLTDYFVARDISGHVGARHRCKTFVEVRTFKQQLGDVIAAKVRRAEVEYNLSSRGWSESVGIVLKFLTKA
jgi:hypothetical protein